MTAIRTAAFAIAAAAALAPAAAHACELHPRDAVHVKVHAAPGAMNAGWNAREGHHGRGHEWERGGRDGGWRAAHERAELRAEYAQLDAVRARFHARPHPRAEVRRFEAWYARERAALDARWKVVVAWRW